MWTKQEIPAQTGKVVLITGANTGLGFEDALAFYEKGAHVIMAVRNTRKGEEALARITNMKGPGSLEVMALDLGSLQAVKAFAEQFQHRHKLLHILINNAGIMMPPPSKTVDGFEIQFGVNFLGHFALTGYLYPLLKAAPGARIVTVSSGAHKWVDGIDYENLRAEKPYDERREYGTSKLANLLFVLELQRRISRAGDQILSLGAHPGITRTELSRHLENAEQSLAQYANIMEPWQGALSTLYAATAPGVAGGQYFGPDGDNELTGYPATAKISKAALDESAGTRLWEYAERLTSVEYP